jgi:hypothetical protein
LYIVLTKYGLCFSGTSFTTWTPARIIDLETGKALLLMGVFECEVRLFWKDCQFPNAGLDVGRSSSDETVVFTHEVIIRTNDLFIPNEDQRMMKATYKDQFESAMGDMGVK